MTRSDWSLAPAAASASHKVTLSLIALSLLNSVMTSKEMLEGWHGQHRLLSYIRVDAPSHLRAPVMHAVAILHDVVGGAERAGVPNRVDFVLRSDNRLYAHD